MRTTSESAEWIFLATNLGLEMLSAACDQASSPRRPHYALFGMLLAIAAVLISIWELIYRGKRERVVLRRWGMLWWFYHPPPPRHTPFGTLPDIYGLVAGISQCICSIVQYVYCLWHADNPFKASLLPAIFLLCLGASKLSTNRMNANTTNNKGSWENSSSTVETLWHAIAANIPSLDDQEVEGNIEQQWLQEEQRRQQQLQQWLRRQQQLQQWLQEQEQEQEQEREREQWLLKQEQWQRLREQRQQQLKEQWQRLKEQWRQQQQRQQQQQLQRQQQQQLQQQLQQLMQQQQQQLLQQWQQEQEQELQEQEQEQELQEQELQLQLQEQQRQLWQQWQQRLQLQEQEQEQEQLRQWQKQPRHRRVVKAD